MGFCEGSVSVFIVCWELEILFVVLGLWVVVLDVM